MVILSSKVDLQDSCKWICRYFRSGFAGIGVSFLPLFR